MLPLHALISESYFCVYWGHVYKARACVEAELQKATDEEGVRIAYVL